MRKIADYLTAFVGPMGLSLGESGIRYRRHMSGSNPLGRRKQHDLGWHITSEDGNRDSIPHVVISK